MNNTDTNLPLNEAEASVIRNFRITASDHKVYAVNHYNLSAKLTAEIAQTHAESEFEKYRIVQDRLFESDFDHFLALEERSKTVKQEGDRE
jgi:hypothetical protein